MSSILAAPTVKIILASSSIGRKRVLKNLGLKFTVIPADIDEGKITTTNPITLAKKIAKAKALAVAKKLSPSPYTLSPLIIAADSMVVFRGKTYGKPKNRQEAKRFLRMFSGNTHEFASGLCVINSGTGKQYLTSCKTKVKFERLTQREIENYVRLAPVTLFAGAYSLEEKGAKILRPKIKIFGSKSNVLGLPIEKLVPILEKNQVKI